MNVLYTMHTPLRLRWNVQTSSPSSIYFFFSLLQFFLQPAPLTPFGAWHQLCHKFERGLVYLVVWLLCQIISPLGLRRISKKGLWGLWDFSPQVSPPSLQSLKVSPLFFYHLSHFPLKDILVPHVPTGLLLLYPLPFYSLYLPGATHPHYSHLNHSFSAVLSCRPVLCFLERICFLNDVIGSACRISSEGTHRGEFYFYLFIFYKNKTKKFKNVIYAFVKNSTLREVFL